MSSLFTFILVLQALVAAVMIGVILMQKSEGGGLGVGGSPAGLLSARGAADFMTRATTILATAFVALSIVLAAMASVGRSGSTIDTSLSKTAQTSGAAPASSLTAPAQPMRRLPWQATTRSPPPPPPRRQARKPHRHRRRHRPPRNNRRLRPSTLNPPGGKYFRRMRFDGLRRPPPVE